MEDTQQTMDMINMLNQVSLSQQREQQLEIDRSLLTLQQIDGSTIKEPVSKVVVRQHAAGGVGGPGGVAQDLQVVTLLPTVKVEPVDTLIRETKYI